LWRSRSDKACNRNLSSSPERGASGMSETLFPHKTIQYEETHPVTDDGIDIVESLEEIRTARKALDSALFHCSDPVELERLLEDEARFSYGESMFDFYNRMIRAVLFHHRGKKELAALEVRKAERLAAELEQMVDVVQSAGSHGSAANGFEAAQLDHAFEFLSKKYGELSTRE